MEPAVPAAPATPAAPTLAPEPAPAAPPAPTPPASVDDAGKGGKEAVLADLAKERGKRQALELQLADAQTAQQKQLDAIATALGLKDDANDPAKIAEQLVESQRVAAQNAAALTRYQAAVEKAVPSHLVEFISGETREQVEASIEKVLAAFSASTPTGPRPDPSQGAQGAPASLDALIAAAQAAGNTREAIRLKARKGLNPTT